MGVSFACCGTRPDSVEALSPRGGSQSDTRVLITPRRHRAEVAGDAPATKAPEFPVQRVSAKCWPPAEVLATVMCSLALTCAVCQWFTVTGVVFVATVAAAATTIPVLQQQLRLRWCHASCPEEQRCPQKRQESDEELTQGPALRALNLQWKLYIARFPTPALPVRGHDEGIAIEYVLEFSAEHVEQLHCVTLSDLARYLVAREGNVAAALHQASSVALWRASVLPASVVSSQIRNCLAQNVVYFAGWSKCGYPVIVLDPTNFRPSKYHSVDEYIRYMGYIFELATKAFMGPGVSKFVVMSDLSTFSSEVFTPIAMNCVKDLAYQLDQINAERLAAMFFMNCNSLFRASWNIFRRFAHQRSVRKLFWPPPKENRAIVGRYIDVAMLENRFGGDLPDRTYSPLVGNWDTDVAERLGSGPPCFDRSAPDPLWDVLEGCD